MLQEASQGSIAETARRHQLSEQTLYAWRRKFAEGARGPTSQGAGGLAVAARPVVPGRSTGQLFGRSPVPLYAQLAELLRQRIARGVWRIGQKVPSIESIVSEFEVARVTVRQAVALLQDEGLLSAQPGRGTFVTGVPGKERWLKLETSLRALADVYRHDKPQLTLLEDASATAPLASDDGLPAPGYHFMRRVHSRNNEAFCVISLYLDERVFQLAPARFRAETVIPVLLDLPAVVIASARQTLTISSADVGVAQQLGVPLNAPVAVVRRVFKAPDGTVLYLGEVVYRGDYIHFELDLRP